MSSDSISQNNSFLFKITITIHEREFRGKSSGRELDKRVLEFNNKSEFLQLLWTHARPLIKSKVLIVDDNFEWATGDLSVADLEDFVLIGVSKKLYKISNLTQQQLVNWQESKVLVYVHVYSLSLSNQALFKRALIDPLEKNRAGAATNAAVEDIAQHLKAIHRFNFIGRDIHWKIWAKSNYSKMAFYTKR